MYLLLIFFLMLAIPFFVMPKMILTAQTSPYRVVLTSTIVITAASTIVFMTASLTGDGIYAQLQDTIELVSAEAVKNPMMTETFRLMGVSTEDQVGVLIQMYNSVFRVLPVCIMFMGAVVSYLAYLILSRFLKQRNEIQLMPKFREFSFPRGAATAVMLMYLIAWILTETGTLADTMLYANMNLLFDLMFSLQGVAVILMFFHLKRFPRALGIVAVIILWETAIGKLLLTLLGLFDLMLGLRSKMRGSNIR